MCRNNWNSSYRVLESRLPSGLKNHQNKKFARKQWRSCIENRPHGAESLCGHHDQSIWEGGALKPRSVSLMKAGVTVPTRMWNKREVFNIRGNKRNSRQGHLVLLHFGRRASQCIQQDWPICNQLLAASELRTGEPGDHQTVEVSYNETRNSRVVTQ